MTSSQETTVTQREGVTIVQFGQNDAEITVTNLPEIRRVLLDAANSAVPPNLVLDFSSVKYFSSLFIEVLFRVWHNINTQEGSRFALCSLSTDCQTVIEVSKLDQIWEIYPSLEKAEGAFATN